MKEFNLHYYPYFKSQGFGPKTLVDQGIMGEALQKLKPHISKADEFGYKVRVAETNSVTSEWGYWVTECLADAASFAAAGCDYVRAFQRALLLVRFPDGFLLLAGLNIGVRPYEMARFGFSLGFDSARVSIPSLAGCMGPPKSVPCSKRWANPKAFCPLCSY
jgi:hypothetical protein